MTEEKAIVTNSGESIPVSALQYQNENASSTVYFLAEISPESLVKAYDALEWTPTGKVGLKISTGESEKSNHLRPALIEKLVKKLDATIVECNTAYAGSRMTTESHRAEIAKRGYNEIAPVDILDEDGSIILKVENPVKIAENFVGGHFRKYDSFVVLSHFKGHIAAGLGGALKNISIGFASTAGKMNIHSAGRTRIDWHETLDEGFLESMADAAKSVHTTMEGRIVYVNVMNRLSVDCDCDAAPDEPKMKDIGVLASRDPIALDQACVDLVYASKDDTAPLRERMESRDAFVTIETAEKHGFGSRSYKLVNLDE